MLAVTNHSPFGVTLSGRNFTLTGAEKGRFGFQGQENDNEIKGEGNSVNYTYRMHDPRLGRFFAVDPLRDKYPYNSPYSFSENRVIDAVELEGLEKAEVSANMKLTRSDNNGGTAETSFTIVARYDFNLEATTVVIYSTLGTLSLEYNAILNNSKVGLEGFDPKKIPNGYMANNLTPIVATVADDDQKRLFQESMSYLKVDKAILDGITSIPGADQFFKDMDIKKIFLEKSVNLLLNGFEQLWIENKVECGVMPGGACGLEVRKDIPNPNGSISYNVPFKNYGIVGARYNDIIHVTNGEWDMSFTNVTVRYQHQTMLMGPRQQPPDYQATTNDQDTHNPNNYGPSSVPSYQPSPESILFLENK